MQQQTGSLGLVFDATQHDPSQGTGQLPVGKHLVKVTGGELKATKANDGGYLQLKITIVEGPHAGSSGNWILNIHNKNPNTIEIAFRELSALCHAIGVYKVDNVSQLMDRPFMVQVQAQVDNPQYTEVCRIFDANGNEPKRGQAPAQPQPQQPQQYAAPHGGTVVQQPPQQQYQQPQPQQYAAPQELAPPPQMQQGPPTTQWGAQAPPQGQWGPQSAPPTPTWGAPPQ